MYWPFQSNRLHFNQKPWKSSPHLLLLSKQMSNWSNVTLHNALLQNNQYTTQNTINITMSHDQNTLHNIYIYILQKSNCFLFFFQVTTCHNTMYRFFSIKTLYHAQIICTLDPTPGNMGPLNPKNLSEVLESPNPETH